MQRYTIAKSTVIQRVDQEAVLINLDTGIYFGLDEMGLVMFDLITELGLASEIINTLNCNYDAPTEQLSHDLAEFITKLEASGLIKIVSE